MRAPIALLGERTFRFANPQRKAGIRPAKIDLSRYMGTWRVIGCTDNPVERKFVDATESYSLEDGSHLHVVFEWRNENFDETLQTYKFRGRVTKDPSHGVWKMHPFPLIAVTYIVVEVADDYSWAAVAHPSKKFGWLLAREKQVSEEIWRSALNKFGTLGYDTTKFIMVSQPK